jgi:hypothetical protein
MTAYLRGGEDEGIVADGVYLQHAFVNPRLKNRGKASWSFGCSSSGGRGLA